MKCPQCKRVLYSRLHPRCGDCGGLLPQKLKFTARELAEIRAEMRGIELRRQQAKAKLKEEEERRRINASLGGGAVVASILQC
jgi:hypothetical protein